MRALIVETTGIRLPTSNPRGRVRLAARQGERKIENDNTLTGCSFIFNFQKSDLRVYVGREFAARIGWDRQTLCTLTIALLMLFSHTQLIKTSGAVKDHEAGKDEYRP